MTESCRLITEEQYKEWKASEKKLEIATKALKGISIWGDNGNGGEQACKTVASKALKEMEVE